ncbi:hypothetical protein TcWFU_005460 [Taenia crassiceps]|uniref:Uncharacterized protein n=1 Tax=Taenia crassiceps TaxID=6207 RepID=A0ABR4QH65_9CEST
MGGERRAGEDNIWIKYDHYNEEFTLRQTSPLPIVMPMASHDTSKLAEQVDSPSQTRHCMRQLSLLLPTPPPLCLTTQVHSSAKWQAIKDSGLLPRYMSRQSVPLSSSPSPSSPYTLTAHLSSFCVFAWPQAPYPLVFMPFVFSILARRSHESSRIPLAHDLTLRALQLSSLWCDRQTKAL